MVVQLGGSVAGGIEHVSVLEPIVAGQGPKLRELVTAEVAFEGRSVCVLQEVCHHSFVTVKPLVAHSTVLTEEHALVLHQISERDLLVRVAGQVLEAVMVLVHLMALGNPRLLSSWPLHLTLIATSATTTRFGFLSHYGD